MGVPSLTTQHAQHSASSCTLRHVRRNGLQRRKLDCLFACRPVSHYRHLPPTCSPTRMVATPRQQSFTESCTALLGLPKGTPPLCIVKNKKGKKTSINATRNQRRHTCPRRATLKTPKTPAGGDHRSLAAILRTISRSLWCRSRFRVCRCSFSTTLLYSLTKTVEEDHQNV